LFDELNEINFKKKQAQRIFEDFFGRNFLGGIFWEKCFGRIFLGRIFLGGIFCEKFFGRKFLGGIF
jgi:hypothetical protein